MRVRHAPGAPSRPQRPGGSYCQAQPPGGGRLEVRYIEHFLSTRYSTVFSCVTDEVFSCVRADISCRRVSSQTVHPHTRCSPTPTTHESRQPQRFAARASVLCPHCVSTGTLVKTLSLMRWIAPPPLGSLLASAYVCVGCVWAALRGACGMCMRVGTCPAQRAHVRMYM